MTWLPPSNNAATRARFIALYGEDLWNQIQELGKAKPLAAREVMKPKPPTNDRPALQTADSEDPMWWNK
jgi:hypothetical protein